ncbi:hypothetical protein [Clostridium sp. UBA871]|uniref:hypothetical protein n=1 Tax=Clostridium sp. UBA871 TaxID=1946380 RepID=UPI003217D86F
MQQNEMIQLQRVFNIQIASKLLSEGFKLYDTHPNRKNTQVTVFRFYDSNKLQNRLNELRVPYKKVAN